MGNLTAHWEDARWISHQSGTQVDGAAAEKFYSLFSTVAVHVSSKYNLLD